MQQKEMTYKLKVNDFEFSFTQEEIDALDVVERTPGHFHLVQDHRSVSVSVVDCDSTAKHQKVEIEGAHYNITILDDLDQMLGQLGFDKASSKQLKEVKAPMPGLVLEINVEEKQQVKKGDKLLILVAMKMENSITIPDDATIKRIAIKPGQAVDKGQLLLELE